MRLCSCGHVLWLTAGVRACGSCDAMGEWPRVNGTAVTVDRNGHRSTANPPYDWATDEGTNL